MTSSIFQHKLLENDTPPATPTSEKSPLGPVDEITAAKLKDRKQAEELVDEILCIADELASREDLKPCSRVNDLFGQLVSTCIKPWNKTVVERVLGDREIERVVGRLRELCAEGEGELERYWADKFLGELDNKGADDKQKDIRDPARISAAQTLLTQFPYHQNYIDLVHLEQSNILAALQQQPQSTPSSPLSLAFIGSGPLPFTSFLFASHLPTAKITNIDIDAHAINLSSRLSQHLGHSPSQMSFLHSDATTLSSLHEFDIVFCAALVGMDYQQKLQILQNLVGRMRKGALLVTRSACGLRGLLYPVLETEEVGEGLVGVEIVLEVRPWNHIVNSTLVMRVL